MMWSAAVPPVACCERECPIANALVGLYVNHQRLPLVTCMRWASAFASRGVLKERCPIANVLFTRCKSPEAPFGDLHEGGKCICIPGTC